MGLPCEASDDMLWEQSSLGYFTNKGSGRCIGFGKKGATSTMDNRLVAVDLHDHDDHDDHDHDDHDHEECARPSKPPFDSDTLSIPDCDTEMAGFGFKMPCQVRRYKDLSGNWWLVAYGGRMVKLNMEEAPLGLLQESSRQAGKVCPTIAQVSETPREKRHECWDAKREY